jgi:hypothetical protein
MGRRKGWEVKALLLTCVLILLPASPCRSQQAISIDRLREQIQRLEAIDRDPTLPPKRKETNRSYLQNQRVQQIIRADRELAYLSHRELGWFHGCARGGSTQAFGACVVDTSDRDKVALESDFRGGYQKLSTELKLTLPDSLAREAEASGLLTPEAIEALLREEIRRRRVNQLFEAADRLANLDMPPLTEAEVEAEIEAARRSCR